MIILKPIFSERKYSPDYYWIFILFVRYNEKNDWWYVLYNELMMHVLVQRAYDACSYPQLLSQEIDKLSRSFCSNGYPRKFFQNIVNQFMSRKTITSNQRRRHWQKIHVKNIVCWCTLTLTEEKTYIQKVWNLD